jgi:hypothetical protein
VGTFDEYLLHSVRTHADPGCSWLRQLIKSLGGVKPSLVD